VSSTVFLYITINVSGWSDMRDGRTQYLSSDRAHDTRECF